MDVVYLVKRVEKSTMIGGYQRTMNHVLLYRQHWSRQRVLDPKHIHVDLWMPLLGGNFMGKTILYKSISSPVIFISWNICSKQNPTWLELFKIGNVGPKLSNLSNWILIQERGNIIVKIYQENGIKPLYFKLNKNDIYIYISQKWKRNIHMCIYT